MTWTNERIEALAERMLDEGNGWGFKAAMVAQEAAATLRALAARVVELEAALRAIAAHGDNCGCHQDTFINIARAALEPSHD